MAKNNKELLLSSEELKELGYRLQASYEIIEKFNEDKNDNKEVIEIANKQVLDIATILMNIEDKDTLEWLRNKQ